MMKHIIQWQKGRLKMAMFTFLSLLLLVLIGCAPDNAEPISQNEREWQQGQGDLPGSIGNEQNLDEPVTDGPAQGNMENEWSETKYDAPTGKWFFHNGEGIFGYGLTSGTQKAGEQFYVTLIGHGEDGDALEREVRIQLTELQNAATEQEVILDEVVYVEMVHQEERIYTGYLPEKENVSYILSAEILAEDGQVEDTRVTFIYVPVPEINAALKMDQVKYSTADTEATLRLENYGPTILFLGTYYTIEKKVAGEWRVVPSETAFEDIGILLDVDEQYEQRVDISHLDVGEYRVWKEIGAEGLDLRAILAVEFMVE